MNTAVVSTFHTVLEEYIVIEHCQNDARRALRKMIEESQRLNHEYVGTEHLLFALLRMNDAGILAILHRYRLDPETLREEMMQRIEPGPDMVTMGRMPYTPRLQRAQLCALEEATSPEHTPVVTPVHLFLGLIRVPEGKAGELLEYFGIRIGDARDAVINQAPATAP